MVSLAEVLRSCGAVKYGDFRLTSGRRSNYYVDVKRAVTRPEVLRAIVRAMLPYVEGHRRLAGTELGAIPLVVALSLESSVPYVMIRREARLRGTQRGLEGDLEAGDRVLLVEDVTTTGGTLTRAVELLREAGGVVQRAVCVVDRGEGALEALAKVGVELVPLVKAQDLLEG